LLQLRILGNGINLQIQDLETGFTHEFRVGAACETEQYGIVGIANKNCLTSTSDSIFKSNFYSVAILFFEKENR